MLFASGYGLFLRYLQAKSKDDYNLDEKFVFSPNQFLADVMICLIACPIYEFLFLPFFNIMFVNQPGSLENKIRFHIFYFACHLGN